MVPEFLHVGPHRYTVVVDDPDVGDRGTNGETYPERCRILIGPHQVESARRETLLHEAIHAVWHTTGLGSHPDIEDHEELIIDSLAAPMLALLRDNPHLVSYLTDQR